MTVLQGAGTRLKYERDCVFMELKAKDAQDREFGMAYRKRVLESKLMEYFAFRVEEILRQHGLKFKGLADDKD